MAGLSSIIPFNFEHPAWLWALVLVPLLAVTSWHALTALRPLQRYTALLMRAIVMMLIVACLAGVHYVRENDDLTVIFVLDRSNSIPRDQYDRQESYIRQVAEKAPPGDRVGVVTFDGQSYVEQLPSKGGVFIETFPETVMPDRTDMTGAVRMAMALFPHDTSKRVVILSDGNNNVGDVLDEIAAARSSHVAVDVVPLRYSHVHEVFVEKLIAPPSIQDGDIVPLRAVIHSNSRVTGTIRIEDNGRAIELPEAVRRQTLEPGANPIGVKVPVQGSSVHEFSLSFIPDRPSADTLPENNVATAYSVIGGEQRVLILTSDVDDDAALALALRAEEIQADVLAIADAGNLSLAWLRTYASVILSNVGADWFTDEQLVQLAAYVRDLGGGLVMTGGDQSFGAGGWIGTPIEAIMPVDFEIKHRQVIPRGALVVIMHSCEMPRGNYWGKLVAKKAVDTISSKDYFGMLEYNHMIGAAWGVPLQVATNKSGIKLTIDKMANGDMPDFDSTIRLAVQGLMELPDAAQRHIIIISDGDASPPVPAVMQQMIDNKITCSTVAIGYGQHVMEVTLRNIAEQTKGRFYGVRNPKRLPHIFVKESKVVRRPLIIDQPFQPHVQYALSDLWAGFAADEALPPLGGLVMTSPKKDSFVEMPLVRRTNDGTDPLLAHWQVGLGRSVAFTSGYWRRWGQDWVNWPQFSKLWAQIVRWSIGKGQSANYDVTTRVDGGVGRIVVNALDQESNYIDLLALSARVVGPHGTETTPLIQVGPGRYEGRYAVQATGQYVIGVERREGEGGLEVVGHAGASVAYSPEYKELRANEAMLQEIADRGAGRLIELTEVDDAVFRRDGLMPTRYRRAVWEWIVTWLLLPAFLLDVAVRRLASIVALSVAIEVLVVVVLLFGVGLGDSPTGVLGVLVFGECLGWAIRYQAIRPTIDYLTGTVTALAGAGQQSAASLEQLRGARDRAREEQVRPATEELQPLKGPQAAIDARRRFDVGERQGEEPVGDLRDELGGRPAASPRRPPSDDVPAGEGDMTARLLKARRRFKDHNDPQDGPGKPD